MLVCVVGVVALMMLASLIGFVERPDPSVKAGPMYVMLGLTTISVLLMLVMALNASYLRIVPRHQTANVQLVMWATGLTGMVTGLLTLGRGAGPSVTRFVFASLAFAFIMIRDARLTRAHAAAPSAPEDREHPASPRPTRRPRARQRRGGRRH